MLTPFTVGSNGRSFVDEWLPTSVRQPHVLVALAMVVAVVGLWIAREHRPRPWEGLLLVAALGLILSMQRTVPVGAFVLAPMLARELDARFGAHVAVERDLESHASGSSDAGPAARRRPS